jgi:peptide-methionine (S)-S-oxide reductase
MLASKPHFRLQPPGWFSHRGLIAALLFALTGGVAVMAARTAAAEQPRALPAPSADEQAAMGDSETAVFAGGCFWGVQGVFQHVQGVTSAVSGYAGGDAATAHYQMVGTDRTGHAESVKITFDPKKISYGKILQIYFSVAHNPTELNFQGPDVGTQYRSAIFYANDEQKKVAEAYIAQLDKTNVFGEPIVTKLEPLRGFYAAENYHQDYATLHPSAPYIAFNDLPKIENLKRLFAADYREMPVTVMAASKPGE